MGKYVYILSLFLLVFNSTAFSQENRWESLLPLIKEAQSFPINQAAQKAIDSKPRPSVVFMWASWCQFCKQQIRWLTSMKKLEPWKDINVVGISVDKTPADALAGALIENTTIKLYFLKNDELWKKLNIDQIPVTFILSTNNQVIGVYTGVSNERFSLIRKKALGALNHAVAD